MSMCLCLWLKYIIWHLMLLLGRRNSIILASEEFPGFRRIFRKDLNRLTTETITRSEGHISNKLWGIQTQQAEIYVAESWGEETVNIPFGWARAHNPFICEEEENYQKIQSYFEGHRLVLPAVTVKNQLHSFLYYLSHKPCPSVDSQIKHHQSFK